MRDAVDTVASRDLKPPPGCASAAPSPDRILWMTLLRMLLSCVGAGAAGWSPAAAGELGRLPEAPSERGLVEALPSFVSPNFFVSA